MKIMHKINKHFIKSIFIFVLIFSLGAGLGYGYFAKFKVVSSPIQQEKNLHKAFLSESFDKIKENYWDNLSDAQLIDMFKIASSVLGKPISAKVSSKDGLIKELEGEAKSSDNANKFIVNLVSQVLTSLQPVGRSGLFTTKQEEQLKNTVQNVNPEKDLYKDLGLAKGASEEAIKEAYQKKENELKKDNSPQAQEQIKQLTYAKNVLTEKDTKQRYDSGGIEPTIFTKIIDSSVLFLQFKKFSPTSLDEFQKAFEDNKDNAILDTLILDLRGNIGGTIDATAYLLGFFIGRNQYAFDFFRKGEYLPFKTPTEKVASTSKFRQIVVLVDNATQSSAEMLASTFKKYHLGIVLGQPTKGWGTVERIFQLDNQIQDGEKYSMFLVHSITLREDNQPIEGRGVEPDVKITDPNWEQKLFNYFRNQNLIGAVKAVL